MRIELESISKVKIQLEKKLEDLKLLNKNVYAVDFSHTDLNEEELHVILEIIQKHGVRYLDISDTHFPLVGDKHILDLVQNIQSQLEFSKNVPKMPQKIESILEDSNLKAVSFNSNVVGKKKGKKIGFIKKIKEKNSIENLKVNFIYYFEGL